MDQDRAESTSESADVRHVLKAFYDGYRNVHRNDRLEMGPVVRTFISCSSGFMMGVALGSSQGSLMAGLRFRAENSHRFPTSQRGWFFYHKSKNYHMALGAIKEGLKTGLKYSFWVGLFMSTENAVDKLRAAFARPRTGLSASQDLGSSVVAGLGTAGAFSLLSKSSLLAKRCASSAAFSTSN